MAPSPGRVQPDPSVAEERSADCSDCSNELAVSEPSRQPFFPSRDDQSSTNDSKDALPPTAVVLVEVVRSLTKRSR